jgi:RNA polymerase sigma-70 factor (ECF subfamily)
MSAAGPGEVTRILERAREGDRAAAEQLLPLIYGELRAIAGARMRGQARGHTLQPTDLVHEAYLKLMDRTAPWESRSHFYCVAAKAMRSVLVDHARARKAAKRGGGHEREPLHEAVAWFEERKIDLLALDEALEALGAVDETKRRVVELRFFAGLTNDRISDVLGISRATVERHWAMARAWLHRRMTQEGGEA